MRPGRLFSPLLLLTMANLAFVSSDLVCSTHAGGHHAESHSTMPAGAHHGTLPAKKPCDGPSRPDCCQAVTSCGPSLSLAVAFAPLDVVRDRADHPRAADE